MKRYMTMLTIGVIATVSLSALAEENPTATWMWYEEDALCVRGRGFSDVDTYFCRLPARAKDAVRPPIWHLAHDSTGFFVRFRAQAKKLRVEWKVRNENATDPLIPAAGLIGIDVYEKTDEGWTFRGNKRYYGNGGKDPQPGVAEFGWAEGAEGMILLPIRAQIESFRMGVPIGGSFEPVGFPKGREKPVVHYGTSIVHGGCASRPGLAFTSIAQRELDRDYINLGFSANGRMEVEMVPFLAELDAAVYVVDCARNMDPKMVAENGVRFLRELKRVKPETPILLCEGCNTDAKRLVVNDALRKVYEELKNADAVIWRNLYYFAEEGMLPRGQVELTHDFCHPNDAGMLVLGPAYAKRIREVLEADAALGTRSSQTVDFAKTMGPVKAVNGVDVATQKDMLTTVALATALAVPGEVELKARLPDIFAKSATHYKALDAAATPLAVCDVDLKEGAETTRLQGPHGFNHKTGKLDMRSIYWWTAGHYPGSLWYLFEATGDVFFRERATFWTERLAPNSMADTNHDLGFITMTSFGNARRILKTEKHDAILCQTAKTLCGRYHEGLGLVRSWGKVDDAKDFLVIPDSMMNLELLEWAGKNGFPQADAIARSHATVTMRHHFRADGGTYHVLNYDQRPGFCGTVQEIRRGQGLSCETAWSRGQSWAIYGYTMMYRETKDPAYLAFAQKVSDYAINHPNMPADGVPYWDYGAPGEERDTSAATVMASGLLELAEFVCGEKGAKYRAFAVKQLLSLSSPEYFSEGDEIGHFLLKHGVGHKPAGSEIDTPLDYGDYYFLEALVRFSCRH